MQTEQLRTNLVCNQNCGFCLARDSRHDAQRFGRAKLLREIAELPERLSEVVVTGGEPTLRADLPLLISTLKARAPARLLLETNGVALSAADLAGRLQKAGLDAVRVAMPAWGESCDALTRTPGSFAHTLRGIGRALKVGLEIEIGITLTRPTLEDAPHLPARIAERWPEIKLVWLQCVTQAPPEFLSPLEALARAVEALARACERHALPYALDPTHAPAPCLLPAGARLPSLRVLPRLQEETRRLPACERCSLSDRCPGLPAASLARFGIPDVSPLRPSDRRRYLDTGSSTVARTNRSLRSDGVYSPSDGTPSAERVLRTIFACNQNCAFCFVDRELPPPSVDRVREEIRQAAIDGVGLLSLSGGEPTLDPHLLEYVRLAHDLGLRVQIQTNAVRLAQGNLAAELAKAGLNDAFVSLHGPDSETSETITRAPGTFVHTLDGIDALLDARIEVRLNCVITGRNYRSLPKLVRLISERFGSRPFLIFSWAHASTSLVPVSKEISPSWTSVEPWLNEAVDLAQQLGLRWRGLDGQCGLPLCLPGRALLDLNELPQLPDAHAPEGFLKTEVCEGCALTLRCVGIRANHARLHGVEGLRAFSEAEVESWRAGERRRQEETG